MSCISSSLWTKTVAVGVVAVASVVGNVSLSASEEEASVKNPPPATLSSPGKADISIAGGSTLTGGSLSGFGYSRFYSSASGVEGGAVPQPHAQISEASASSESGQVVPAIYAWDPDVRYVFYRHVSKWM